MDAKIKRWWIEKNVGLRLLSVALATLLWFYVHFLESGRFAAVSILQ